MTGMIRAFSRTRAVLGPGRHDVDIAMSKWWTKKRPAEGQVRALWKGRTTLRLFKYQLAPSFSLLSSLCNWDWACFLCIRYPVIKKICDLVGNGCFLVFVLTNFSFPFFSHIKNRSLDQFPPMSNTLSEDGSRPSPRRLWTVLLLTSSGSEEVLALPTEVSELPNTSPMPKITLTDLKFDVIFSKLRKCKSNHMVWRSLRVFKMLEATKI